MKLTKFNYTAGGEIKLISFKKFLELIPREQVNEAFITFGGGVRFQARTSIANYGGSPFIAEDDDAIDMNAVADDFSVIESKLGDDNELLNSLMIQGYHGFVGIYNLHKLAEDLHTQDLMNFGMCQYIVNVSKRRWMVASLDDFKIFEHNGLRALACLQRPRTFILEIKRAGEIQQIVDNINKIADGVRNDRNKDM